MKNFLQGVITFLLPSFICIFILKIFGVKIGKNVKIGFSFITSKISFQDNVKIGHFNLIINNVINLEKNTSIGYLNILKGPFKLCLKHNSSIGNKNYFTRAIKGVTYGVSKLTLGNLTKITTSHHIDLTKSVIIGNNSILAGINTQLWTHGYYHANEGAGRIRIDGEIHIGNNVYVGSRCIFNPGVLVKDAIHIGAGSIVSKNLNKSGMYVSHGLRFIENDIVKVKSKLEKVEEQFLVEDVYKKRH
jgi:acetyltransferase-like isoleucine patch superfamily enzyme